MQKRFDTIATHHRPHFDEITTIWLFKKFGEAKFPGISQAKIMYVDAGSEPSGDMKEYQWEARGILAVGVWGGRFDEHPTLWKEREEGECAATLVAKALGVENDPSLEKILKFVVNNDLKASGSPFDLPYIVKLLHQQHSDKPEIAMEWSMIGIEAKYLEQLQFWTRTKEEFEKTADIEEIEVFGGHKLKMVAVVSDDEQISKFARSEHGADAAVVIQRCSTGNTQIYMNKKYGLTAYDVAQMIRLAEQEAKGKVITTDWRDLSREGRVEGAEEWYFHHEGQMLLNGSLTAKNIPPTKLSIEKIKGIMRIGINPQAFESSRESKCKDGICTIISNNRCPWYKWGLHRCRKIRFEMKEKNGRSQSP